MAKRGSSGRRRRPLPKNLKQVIDPVLAQALSHPLRGHILGTLADRVASPSEVARELEMNARDLSYHFGILDEIGMIKLVRTERRRGAHEHFYALSSRLAYLDEGRMAMVLDEQGCDDVHEVMIEALQRLQEIRSSPARAKTESSIGSVRRPVKVFCWLG